MRVTPEQITAYNSDSVHKEISVQFPNLGLFISNEQIYQESLS